MTNQSLNNITSGSEGVALMSGVEGVGFVGLCSHLQRRLFSLDGDYHAVWMELQRDGELSAVARNRQLHIYRNGKKILVLAGKSQPKFIREDRLNDLLIG